MKKAKKEENVLQKAEDESVCIIPTKKEKDKHFKKEITEFTFQLNAHLAESFNILKSYIKNKTYETKPELFEAAWFWAYTALFEKAKFEVIFVTYAEVVVHEVIKLFHETIDDLATYFEILRNSCQNNLKQKLQKINFKNMINDDLKSYKMKSKAFLHFEKEVEKIQRDSKMKLVKGGSGWTLAIPLYFLTAAFLYKIEYKAFPYIESTQKVQNLKAAASSIQDIISVEPQASSSQASSIQDIISVEPQASSSQALSRLLPPPNPLLSPRLLPQPNPPLSQALSSQASYSQASYSQASSSGSYIQNIKSVHQPLMSSNMCSLSRPNYDFSFTNPSGSITKKSLEDIMKPKSTVKEENKSKIERLEFLQKLLNYLKTVSTKTEDLKTFNEIQHSITSLPSGSLFGQSVVTYFSTFETLHKYKDSMIDICLKNPNAFLKYLVLEACIKPNFQNEINQKIKEIDANAPLPPISLSPFDTGHITKLLQEKKPALSNVHAVHDPLPIFVLPDNFYHSYPTIQPTSAPRQPIIKVTPLPPLNPYEGLPFEPPVRPTKQQTKPPVTPTEPPTEPPTVEEKRAPLLLNETLNIIQDKNKFTIPKFFLPENKPYFLKQMNIFDTIIKNKELNPEALQTKLKDLKLEDIDRYYFLLILRDSGVIKITPEISNGFHGNLTHNFNTFFSNFENNIITKNKSYVGRLQRRFEKTYKEKFQDPFNAEMKRLEDTINNFQKQNDFFKSKENSDFLKRQQDIFEKLFDFSDMRIESFEEEFRKLNMSTEDKINLLGFLVKYKVIPNEMFKNVLQEMFEKNKSLDFQNLFEEFIYTLALSLKHSDTYQTDINSIKRKFEAYFTEDTTSSSKSESTTVNASSTDPFLSGPDAAAKPSNSSSILKSNFIFPWTESINTPLFMGIATAVSLLIYSKKYFLDVLNDLTTKGKEKKTPVKGTEDKEKTTTSVKDTKEEEEKTTSVKYTKEEEKKEKTPFVLKKPKLLDGDDMSLAETLTEKQIKAIKKKFNCSISKDKRSDGKTKKERYRFFMSNRFFQCNPNIKVTLAGSDFLKTNYRQKCSTQRKKPLYFCRNFQFYRPFYFQDIDKNKHPELILHDPFFWLRIFYHYFFGTNFFIRFLKKHRILETFKKTFRTKNELPNWEKFVDKHSMINFSLLKKIIRNTIVGNKYNEDAVANMIYEFELDPEMFANRLKDKPQKNYVILIETLRKQYVKKALTFTTKKDDDEDEFEHHDDDYEGEEVFKKEGEEEED